MSNDANLPQPKDLRERMLKAGKAAADLMSKTTAASGVPHSGTAPTPPPTGPAGR